MTPPDSPDAPVSNGDDAEWIKGLVAKALLHAADEDAQSPTAPIPTAGPAAEEPTSSPLDTAGVRDAPVVDEGVPIETRSPEPSGPPPIEIDPLDGTSLPAVVSSQVIDSIAAEQQVPLAPFDQGQDLESASPIAVVHEPEQTGGLEVAMVDADATTEGSRSSDIRTVLEWLAVIVSALVVALLIKALVLQAFWIPSESMETTVNKGDRILVNKVSYRLHDVRRGDLVVFEKLEGTPGNTKDLIKRAIALPGETIEIRSDGRIWIWGAGETPDDAQLLEEPYLDPQNAILSAPSASDSLTTDVWDEKCTNQPRTPGRCTLDDSSYFMMGDNRQRSSDSRFFGPVDDENVVGRAFLRIWPLGDIGTL